MKINIRKVLINIACFFILLYPFNSTIASKIYPVGFLRTVSVVISIVMLFFLSKDKKKIKPLFILCFIIGIIMMEEVFTNQYVNRTKMLMFTIYLILPIVVSCNSDSIDGFKKSLNIFSAEHIIFTYIPVFFRNFYKTVILPFLDSAQKESLASSHFKSGYNPGLTTHYSTNGMYLAIITIYLFSKFLKDKSKKNLIFLILSFVALLLTGKRGHAVFTILTCIIMFFAINKDRMSKKVFKFSISVIAIVIFVIAVSNFIPQIMIVFERFEKSMNSGGDMLTGRGDFYDLAMKMWSENKLFGNGWGAFSNQYQIYLYRTFGVTYLDAHNVYVQLLCETGLAGITFIVGAMLSVLMLCIKYMGKKTEFSKSVMFILTFGYQIFFLLYCFSGNALYDPQCYVLYFICIGITLSVYIIPNKQEEITEVK